MSDERLRLDKWLWYARICKTRTLASELCATGKVRVNSAPVTKAHHAVKVGDVLTFPWSGRILVLRVVALATRRGPASEARLLYEDLSPPRPSPAAGDDPAAAAAHSIRDAGSGRPTKAERRAIDRLRDPS